MVAFALRHNANFFFRTVNFSSVSLELLETSERKNAAELMPMPAAIEFGQNLSDKIVIVA